MNFINGSIPIESLIGSVVTIGANTEQPCELDGYVTGIRVDFGGHIFISLSTGVGIPWGFDKSTAPSFHLQEID